MEDNFVGMTVPDQPLKIDNMLEGKYQVKFIKGGYYNWQGDISVLAKIANSRKIAEIYSSGELIYQEIPEFRVELGNITSYIKSLMQKSLS